MSANTVDVTASAPPAENRVLSALSGESYQRLRPHLEFVPLPTGRVLSEPGEPVEHVFFPLSGVVALVIPSENGSSTGIGLIGNEGVSGVSVLLEGLRAGGALVRAVVQSAGYAYRVRAGCLVKEFERSSELRHLLLRTAQMQITQVAQTAVCNRCHRLPERLCTWLLHSLDRIPGDEMRMTQSILSELLGVRRESVTDAAAYLRRTGLLEYRRGHIHVRDRPGLAQRACECYGIVSREYVRLSPRRVEADTKSRSRRPYGEALAECQNPPSNPVEVRTYASTLRPGSKKGALRRAGAWQPTRAL